MAETLQGAISNVAGTPRAPADRPQNETMPIKVTRDGRTIRTGRAYTQFRGTLYMQQDGICGQCGRLVYLSSPLEWDDSFHVHHKHGRGMGGSKRDDTFEECVGLCGDCHRKEHDGVRQARERSVLERST